MKRPLVKIRVLDSITYAGNIQNLQPLIANNQIDFIKGDVCDAGSVSEALKNIDVVYNFAAESHVDRSIESSINFIKSNVLGVENLLYHSLRMGVKQFIQISTDEVYGSVENGSANEDFPLLPNSPYAASKASADLICRSYHQTHGMDIKVTRCTNNYGNSQYPEKLIPLAIKRISSNEMFPVYGNGQNVREWIDVRDHCKGILLVSDRGTSGSVYNIGSGEEFTNLEILSKILFHLKKSDNLLQFVDDRLGHDFRYSLDSSKIRKELGFSCDYQLETSLLDLIKDFHEPLEENSKIMIKENVTSHET
jgi:dTDP-glucose 4,6-dehydratase